MFKKNIWEIIKEILWIEKDYKFSAKEKFCYFLILFFLIVIFYYERP